MKPVKINPELCVGCAKCVRDCVSEKLRIVDGKAQFMFEEVRENPLPTTEEIPIVFNTGRGSVGQWHTQSRTKEVKFVEDVSVKKAYLFMNTKMEGCLAAPRV